MKNAPRGASSGIGPWRSPRFCLVFALYIGWPTVKHLSITQHTVAQGVETQGVASALARGYG